MARYILIDNSSGYIFGDTSDINGAIYSAESPADAARELDEKIVGQHGRSYRERTDVVSGTSVTGYHVYRADVRGSEAVPTVWDGQDQETIDAVERDCQYVCFVECADERNDHGS